MCVWRSLHGGWKSCLESLALLSCINPLGKHSLCTVSIETSAALILQRRSIWFDYVRAGSSRKCVAVVFGLHEVRTLCAERVQLQSETRSLRSPSSVTILQSDPRKGGSWFDSASKARDGPWRSSHRTGTCLYNNAAMWRWRMGCHSASTWPSGSDSQEAACASWPPATGSTLFFSANISSLCLQAPTAPRYSDRYP